jgi:hypothetical protein
LAARARILAPCFTLLALALTGCVPLPAGGTDACARDVADSVEDSLPPAIAQHISAARVEEAAKPVCVELERFVEERGGDGEPTDAQTKQFLAGLMRSRPALYRPLCEAAIDAELESLGQLARFVTTKERARYKTEVCRLAQRFFVGATTKVDHTRLAKAHPELYAPFCAAGIQDALSSDPAADVIGRRNLGVAARRACTEALRRGNASEAALQTIFDRHLRRVAGG